MAIPSAEALEARERWLRTPRPDVSPARPLRAGDEWVWDYPRPPRVEATSSRVTVELAGALIAETTHALRVLETSGAPTIYLPPADVRTDLLEPVSGTTLCEWKGDARYWTIRVGDDHVAERAAWSYPDPFPEYAILRDHVAFYPARVDRCTLGGKEVQPQPGGFYGGWVTAEIVGPFKS